MNRFEDGCFNSVSPIPYAERAVGVPAVHPVSERVADCLVPGGLLKGAMDDRNVGFEDGWFAFQLNVLRRLALGRIVTQVVEEIFRDPQGDDVT